MQPGEVKVGDCCLCQPDPSGENPFPEWEEVEVVDLGDLDPALDEYDQAVTVRRQDGSVVNTTVSRLKRALDQPSWLPGHESEYPKRFWFEECKACHRGFWADWGPLSPHDIVRCEHCHRRNFTYCSRTEDPSVVPPECHYPLSPD